MKFHFGDDSKRVNGNQFQYPAPPAGFTDEDGNPVEFGRSGEELQENNSEKQNTAPDEKSVNADPQKMEIKNKKGTKDYVTVYISQDTAYELSMIKALYRKTKGESITNGEIISKAIKMSCSTLCPEADAILYK